jgi:hypothetical protein
MNYSQVCEQMKESFCKFGFVVSHLWLRRKQADRVYVKTIHTNFDENKIKKLVYDHT